MMKTRCTFTAFIALFLLCGCGIPEPMEISPGLYSIYKQDTAGIFGNPHKMQNDVVAKAKSFASLRGKIAVVESTSFTPIGSGPAQFASFDYRFYTLTPEEFSEFQRRNANVQSNSKTKPQSTARKINERKSTAQTKLNNAPKENSQSDSLPKFPPKSPFSSTGSGNENR
jgi:hypothetical protein